MTNIFLRDIYTPTLVQNLICLTSKTKKSHRGTPLPPVLQQDKNLSAYKVEVLLRKLTALGFELKKDIDFKQDMDFIVQKLPVD